MKKILLCLFCCIAILLASCGSVKNNNLTDSKLPENSNSSDTKTDTVTTKEVIFRNMLFPAQDENSVVEVTYSNIIYSDYVATENEDALYAFVLMFGTYDRRENNKGGLPVDYPTRQKDELDESYYLREEQYMMKKAEEIVTKNGFQLLEDYPYSPYLRYIVDENGEITKNNMELGYGLCAFVGTLKDVERVFDAKEAVEGWWCRTYPAVRPDFLEFAHEAGWTYSGESYFWNWAFLDMEAVEALVGPEKQVTMSVKVEK